MLPPPGMPRQWWQSQWTLVNGQCLWKPIDNVCGSWSAAFAEFHLFVENQLTNCSRVLRQNLEFRPQLSIGGYFQRFVLFCLKIDQWRNTVTAPIQLKQTNTESRNPPLPCLNFSHRGQQQGGGSFPWSGHDSNFPWRISVFPKFFHLDFFPAGRANLGGP